MEYNQKISIEENLKVWENSFTATNSLTKSNLEELKNHLWDDIEYLESIGLSKKESFLIAVKRIGKQETLKTEFEKVNKWYKYSNIIKPYLIGGLIYLIYVKFIEHIAIFLTFETGSLHAIFAKNSNYILTEKITIETIAALIITSIFLIWNLKTQKFWQRFRKIINSPLIILIFLATYFIPILLITYLMKINGNSIQFNFEDKLQLDFINYNIDVFKYSVISLIILLVSNSYRKYTKTLNSNTLKSLSK